MSRIGAGAWATFRLARRDAWRNRGRSALIALMIAIPVLSMSAVSVIYRSDQRDPQDYVTLDLGEQHRNQAAVRLGGGVPGGGALAQVIDGSRELPTGAEPGAVLPSGRKDVAALLASLLPPGDRLLEDRIESVGGTLRHGSRVLSRHVVREFDYAAAGPDGPIRQLSGRSPRAATEVVVTERLARSDGIRAGDTLQWQTSTGVTRLTVVGVIGGNSLRGQSALLAQPGTLLPETESRQGFSSSWLVVGPAAVDWSRVLRMNEKGFVVTSRAVVADPPALAQVPYWRVSGGMVTKSPLDQLQDDVGLSGASGIGVITVAIGLILLQVALLAGPAIAVGARRNERTLALLAVSGGDRRQLRSVVLAGNGLIGLIGSVLAAGLGVGIGAIAVALLRRYDGAEIARVDVHLLDLVALIAVGALTAVAAALIPARQAARLDPVAVLTGRRSRPRAPRRVPVLGVLIALIGCGVCYLGASRHGPFTTIAGIALAEVGLVAVTGSIIALAARGAGRLPFTARFALRDASRQRSRTAPAVAAVMAAIAGSIAVGVYLQSEEASNRHNYQPSAALGSMDVQFRPSPGSRVDDATVATAVDAVRRTLPVQEDVVYQSATGAEVDLIYPPSNVVRDLKDSINGQVYGLREAQPGGFFDDGSAAEIRTGVTDPAIRATLRDGRVVIFNSTWVWPDGTVHVRVAKVGADTRRVVKLHAGLAKSRPGLDEPIYPPSAAAALGVQLAPIGVSVSTSRMPTEAESDAASAAVNAVVRSSLSVEGGYQGHTPMALLALVVAAAVITLGGTFTAVGLAAAEGRTDVATLAAVGAGPAVRRRLAAAQAAVITVLGAGLGLLTGLLAGWALVRVRRPYLPALGERAFLKGYLDGWPFTVPWPTVAALVIGVPLLAILIGYLTTRSRLPLVRRLGQ